MSSQPQESSSAVGRTKPPAAYLVVRDEKQWRDVFRLVPGFVTTVGRAPTNRVVVRDEICSRNHCEIYLDDQRWKLRDLGSRNGTMVNGVRVEGEWELEDGQLIQIGSSDLGFTYDLSHPFPQRDEPAGLESQTATISNWSMLGRSLEEGHEPEILDRRRQSRYQSGVASGAVNRDRQSQKLAMLYQLAIDMGSAGDEQQLGEAVLNGLFAGTSAELGAVLLLPATNGKKAQDSRNLRVAASRAQPDLPYQDLSEQLAKIVLTEQEAVLARDVDDDSQLASRDNLGNIHAQSVICAPIRFGDRLLGLVHLYAVSPESQLTAEDLEFTLAAADQAAAALHNQKERQTLADGLARVQDENQSLRQQLAIESELIGESAPIRNLRETISRIAPTDATALIRGESGVGKELVARAIHFNSARRNGPIVCMNCAALNESLLESELFGHEKGSFTGATERKFGKFEQSHQGTLFLDEVGEMSLSIQAKFLRVLEGHPFERVGGGTPIQVNVRVVAATNRDLEAAVAEKKFRQDLYFRLFVVEIYVPPLRERKTDIPLLANHFLDRCREKMGRPLRGFTADAVVALTGYDWPGNVRELQNAVERAAILCRGDEVSADDIQLSTLGRTQATLPGNDQRETVVGREVTLESLEREHILTTLEQTGWNKSKSAQILGIERSTLDRKLKRYNVQRPPD